MTPDGEGRAHNQVDRSKARAWALQIHYLWEAGRAGSVLGALDETMRTRTIAQRRLPYVRRLLETLDAHFGDVDDHLVAALDNWRLERLSAIDRGVLRLAATELIYLSDVPPKVSIQEAIRLAERYGSAESPKFVNGVLDALYKRQESPAPLT
ncbi:MAG: transcription antitermination factor NusB [Gemmatimonadota bacterium]|nr:MAG: transcription antitermination factor NusB [Gemmatimonadota bacterium]